MKFKYSFLCFCLICAFLPIVMQGSPRNGDRGERPRAQLKSIPLSVEIENETLILSFFDNLGNVNVELSTDIEFYNYAVNSSVENRIELTLLPETYVLKIIDEEGYIILKTIIFIQ